MEKQNQLVIIFLCVSSTACLAFIFWAAQGGQSDIQGTGGTSAGAKLPDETKLSDKPAVSVPPKTDLPPEMKEHADAKLRPDLNGLLLRRGITVWWMDQGAKRWVRDGGVHANLFKAQHTAYEDVESIKSGPTLTSDNRLVREDGTPDVFLMDQGAKRRITSPQALARNHFEDSRIQQVPSGSLRDVPQGPAFE